MLSPFFIARLDIMGEYGLTVFGSAAYADMDVWVELLAAFAH